MSRAKRVLLGLCALLLGLSVLAQSVPEPTQAQKMMCPDAKLWGSGLVTKICWSCVIPIRIMGGWQLGEGRVPDGASDRAVCFCEGRGGIPEIGFTMGMWAPTALIELVRKPYCSPTLGGTSIRESYRLWGMKDGSRSGPSSNQFYNFHWFSFPLYSILELVMAPECNAGGFTDFDLLYMSEIDPTWSEDELAVFTQPEVAVAANPLMQAACPVDCAATSFGKPIDRMWWCAGCWGNLYPFTGNVPSGGSPPRVTSLLAARAVASLHRRGLQWKTVGNDALCGGDIYPMLPKQQYRMSQIYPKPEASNEPPTPPAATTGATGDADIDTFNYSQGCCHPVGTNTFLWGEWRNVPAVGEDFVHLLWRYTDCCIR